MATARRAAEQHQRDMLAPAAPRVDLCSLSIEFDAWSSRRQRSLNEVFVRTSRRRTDKAGTLPTLPQTASNRTNSLSGVGSGSGGSDPSRLTRYTWRNYAQTSWFRQFPDMVYKSAILSQCAPNGWRLAPDARRLPPTRQGASQEHWAAAARRAPRSTYRASELHVRSLAGARASAATGHSVAGKGLRHHRGRAPAPTTAVVFFVGSRFSAPLPLARPLPRETSRSNRSRAAGGGSARSPEDGNLSPRTYKSVASYRRIVESASVERRPPTAPLHCTRQPSAAGASQAEGEEAIINAMEALNFPDEPDVPEWALRESLGDDGAAAQAVETPSGGPPQVAAEYVRGGIARCDAGSCDEDDGGNTFLLTVAVTKNKC